MNKIMKIGLILLTYAILAGIPNVLGYLQFDRGDLAPYSGGSCGKCHVVPGGSISTTLSLNKTDQIPDPYEIEIRILQETEDQPIFEETNK